jgi:hypothetical protein
VDGVSVVALDGRIVLGEERNALREKLKSLIAEGKKKKIVLNILVAAHCSANAHQNFDHKFSTEQEACDVWHHDFDPETGRLRQ